MKTPKKANAGAYLAIAQQAKGVAPNAVDALDRKIARKLDGPKYSDAPLFAKNGALIQDKLDDFYTLKESNEDYDENDDFGIFQKAYDYAKKHLKQSDTSKIYGMDTEGDLEWELDVKTKDVTDKIYGDAKDGYVNVSSGPGVVIIEDAGIEQILFTKDSENSFGFIQYIARYGKKMSTGGTTTIDETGSNLPKPLYELFGELNEDEDSYKEMERLKLKANELGYDFDYDLSGEPTEFWKIDKMSGGGKLERYDDMSDEEIIEWANENDLRDIVEKDIDGKIKNREEVLVTILELNLPNTDSEGYFLTEQFDDTYAHYNKGGKILKQSHLSSEEYQKAKKLKGFDKKDYTWNVATKLYDKSVRKMHGGYIESMGDDFNKGLDRITMAFKEWYNGPMTELDDVMPAIEDIADYVKSRLISEISSVDIYALKPQGSFDDSDKVVARLNKNAPFKIKDEQGNGWRVYFENFPQIIVYATPFWDEEPGTSIVFRDDDDEVIYEHFLSFDYKEPMLSFEDLYKYYRMAVIPWVEESMYNLIVERNFNYFVERGKHYDILDLGMNEWMPDWEFLGPAVPNNETFEYYMHNSGGTKGFIAVVNEIKTTMFVETRNFETGDTIVDGEHTKPFEGFDSVLKQLENLENGQELILTSYESVSKDEDTYYAYTQGTPFAYAGEGIVIDDIKTYLCDTIYRCIIDDYEGIQVDDDRLVFIDNVQFDSKAMSFTLPELLDDLRRALIRPHSGQYKGKPKYEQGGTVYEFSYRDEEGDLYEEVFDTLKEAKDTIKEYRKEGYNVIETWIYKDGEFKGRFEDGGKTQFDKGGYVVGSEVLFKSGRNGDETRGQILKVLDGNEYAVASGFSQTLVKKDDIIGKAPEKKWYQFEDGGKTKETWVQKSIEEMDKKGTVGLFTKKAKKAGMSTTAYAKKVLNKKNEKKYSLKTRREAQWMKNMNPELFKS